MALALIEAVAQRFVCALTLLGLLLPFCGGCAGGQADFQKHARKVESIKASIVLAIAAWLAGDVSGTYASVTLEKAFDLSEQERTALAPRPGDLARPAITAIVNDIQQLERTLAALVSDVNSHDGASARRHLAALQQLHLEPR